MSCRSTVHCASARVYCSYVQTLNKRLLIHSLTHSLTHFWLMFCIALYSTLNTFYLLDAVISWDWLHGTIGLCKPSHLNLYNAQSTSSGSIYISLEVNSVCQLGFSVLVLLSVAEYCPTSVVFVAFVIEVYYKSNIKPQPPDTNS